MNEIILLLNKIPNTVWTGLFGALFTLCGVLISNFYNTKQLIHKLEHETKENTREHKANLRRTVYLEAVEELTKANSYFASIPQKDPTESNLAEGLQGFFCSASKLQLIAEPKTSMLVNQLVACYGELLFKVLIAAQPLHKARQDISIYDELYKQANSQVNRLLGEITAFNESAQTDQIKFNALVNSCKNFQDQAASQAKNRQAAWDVFNNQNIIFCKQLLTELKSITEQQIPVLVEIRRDLGLDSEIDALRQQMESSWQKMMVQFDNLIQSLDSGS